MGHRAQGEPARPEYFASGNAPFLFFHGNVEFSATDRDAHAIRLATGPDFGTQTVSLNLTQGARIN
jgi:hypothetical protein